MKAPQTPPQCNARRALRRTLSLKTKSYIQRIATWEIKYAVQPLSWYMWTAPSVFKCSVADACVVTVIIAVLGPAHSCARSTAAGSLGLYPQRLSHVPIRPEIVLSCEPCANNRPDDMRLKWFPREKGDARLQWNRWQRLAKGKEINNIFKKTDGIGETLPLAEPNLFQTEKR